MFWRKTTRKIGPAVAAFGGAAVATALLGSIFTPARGNTREWFSRLKKPSFQPPDSVFGPVWTLLYTLITASGVRVWRSRNSSDRNAALRLWWSQMALNAAWSPVFFGAKQPGLALADQAVLLPAIVAYMQRARRVDTAAAALMAPYLAWVMFATVLNAEIVRLNHSRHQVLSSDK